MIGQRGNPQRQDVVPPLFAPTRSKENRLGGSIVKLNTRNQIKANLAGMALFCLTFSLGVGLTAGANNINELATNAPTKPENSDCRNSACYECEGINTSSEKFIVPGTYLHDSVQIANEFSELKQLHIREQSPTLRDGTAVVDTTGLGGFLQGDRQFDIAWIGVHGSEIAFQTVIVDGVSYQFMGAQSSKQDCAKLAGGADISGKLIKVVNGTWVATTQVKLYEKCGGG